MGLSGDHGRLIKWHQPDNFAFVERSRTMKAPVGLLSDRTVLRSKMEGLCPDKFQFAVLGSSRFWGRRSPTRALSKSTLPFVLYPPVLSWESVVYSSWVNKSEVVNLELEVLKMKIIIILIDLLMATVLFFVGRFFIKSRNTERSVLFLSGDYTGLNTEKICRVTGKRIKTWAMLFCLGGIIDFIKPGAGIIIVSVFFIILLVFHLVDMTINRDKYRV